MKRFLPILFFSLILFVVSLSFAPITYGREVEGCQATGPSYQLSTGGTDTSYLCYPGTTKNGSACTSGSGGTSSWTPSSPGTLTDTTGCDPTNEFYAKGRGSNPWVTPSLNDTGADVYQGGENGELGAASLANYNWFTFTNVVVMNISGNPAAPKGTAANSGALGFFSNGIGTLASVPPASSLDYTKYMASRLQVPGTTSVYAASGGVGFNSLQPLLQIWSAARNVAYLFFAIAFVIVGVQIMFGTKLKDQKTALSIQMALPKIIIALILVTFSYAIAGFIIDLMYVLIQLIFALLEPMFTDPTPLSNFQAIKDSATGVDNETFFAFMLRGFPYQAASFGNFSNSISTIVSSLTGSGAIQNIIGDVAGGIVTLVIAVAFLYTLFKIWIKLIVAYVQIILAVISAPLVIMLDALPSNHNFEGWLRTIIANALMFPVVIGMTFLSALITTNFGQGSSAGGFVPPLIGNTGGPQIIQTLIGMGILLTIPGLLDQLPKLLKATTNPLGNAWAEPVANNYLSRTAGAIGKKKAANFDAMVMDAAVPEIKHPGPAPVAPADWVHNAARLPRMPEQAPAGATPAQVQAHLAERNRRIQAAAAMDRYYKDRAYYEGKIGEYTAAKSTLGYRAQDFAAKGVAKVASLPIVGAPGGAAASAAGGGGK